MYCKSRSTHWGLNFHFILWIDFINLTKHFLTQCYLIFSDNNNHEKKSLWNCVYTLNYKISSPKIFLFQSFFFAKGIKSKLIFRYYIHVYEGCLLFISLFIYFAISIRMHENDHHNECNNCFKLNFIHTLDCAWWQASQTSRTSGMYHISKICLENFMSCCVYYFYAPEIEDRGAYCFCPVCHSVIL